MEKADKSSYYAFREMSRHTATDLTSMIIDKMDGNKNKCPRQRGNKAQTHSHTYSYMRIFVT
eukprot:5648024-Pleurochrysis_carterae.AAC.1